MNPGYYWPVFAGPDLYTFNPTALGPTHVIHQVVPDHQYLHAKTDKTDYEVNYEVISFFFEDAMSYLVAQGLQFGAMVQYYRILCIINLLHNRSLNI